jgi:hypothetical protein
MERIAWIALGGALFVIGVLASSGGTGDVEASGVAIDQGSRSVVTSSEDGRRMYIWDDRTRFGGKDATVREYFYKFDAEAGDFRVFSRDRAITQLPAESEELAELRASLHVVSEALQALEEIGDTDTDLYRELATKARNIAKAIDKATDSHTPEEANKDATD